MSLSTALAPLDGLRGIASLLVIVGHIMTFWLPNGVEGASSPNTTAISVAALDYLSPVTLFIVISGFTLAKVYGAKIEGETAGWHAYYLFLKRRVARLAPLYYLGLVLGLAPGFVYYGVGQTIISIVVSCFSLQAIVLVSGNSIDGPLWTVSALVFCYAYFPPLMKRIRRGSDASLRRWAVTCALLSALPGVLLIGVAAGGYLDSIAPYIIVLHVFALLRLPQFVLGMLAAELSSRGAFAGRGKALTNACAAICAAALAGGFAYVGAIGPSFEGWEIYSYAAEFIMAGVHAVFVAALAEGPAAGVVRDALCVRPLRLLGEVSYAVYCLHWPILLLGNWAQAGRISGDFAWGWAFANFPVWSLPILLVIIYTISAAAHHLLEKPARAKLQGGPPRTKDGDAAPDAATASALQVPMFSGAASSSSAEATRSLLSDAA